MRTIFLLLSTLTCFAADLPRTLDTLVNSSPLAMRSNIGIHVTDLKTAKTLYARNEDRFFLPASNMKLFTTALALLKLGPDYRFETYLLMDEANRDLVLVGTGDPSLSGRAYPYNPIAPAGPPLGAIEDLADQAIANGLSRVQGDIIGDDRLYPWVPYPPNWTQDDVLHESGAPVSALTVNDNVIAITIAPSAHAGDLAMLNVSPPLEYFSVDNRIITAAGKGEPQVHVARLPGTRQILLWGRIFAAGATARELVAVDDPALYAACALYDALTRRGIVIAGRPIARHREAEEVYQPLPGKTLAMRISPPLVELLRVTDKVSQNLHAELMLREVGRHVGTGATRENGLAVLNTFIQEIGGAPADSRLDDGSGLSRNAEVTPRLLTHLLSYMFHSRVRDEWIAMLPVGGEDGTLARRMCCTAAARAIHAKTGTLARAVALSGYAQSKTRGWLAFSILVNDFAAPAAEIQTWIDKIALALVE